MQELRFVAVSEDGSYAVLAVPGRSARFTLPIDERLRAVALGQTSRLAQYEIEVESPLRPKEIQARIRAGETAEEIADAAGIPVERVRWFEGPVLAERAYVAQQAQAASVRRPGDSSGPGPRLGDIVPSRLKAAGADAAEGQWDSRKRGDGNWQITLTFTSGGRLHVAEWMFDPRRRHVLPDDDSAARLSLPDAELPPLSVPMPGEATVTPLTPRLGAVSAGGMGPGPARAGGSAPLGGPADGGRFRSERPAAAERPAMAERPAVAERSAVAERPAPERPAAPGTASGDSERTRATPQRPLVFEEPAPATLDVQPELTPAPAAPAPAAPAPAREPATAARQEPRTAEPARSEPALPEPALPEPVAEPAAVASAGSAQPAPEEQAAHSRPGKKNARGRRSSVPSWDEIMLGSSRQRD
jgi:Protein of unknown function (DUF3071)